jgi:hypothetical protein
VASERPGYAGVARDAGPALPGTCRADPVVVAGRIPAEGCPKFGTMKKLVELLLCFLHPLAVVLIWIDLLSRTDISSGAKLAWAILVLIPLVPFIYVLTGGDLW